MSHGRHKGYTRTAIGNRRALNIAETGHYDP